MHSALLVLCRPGSRRLLHMSMLVRGLQALLYDDQDQDTASSINWYLASSAEVCHCGKALALLCQLQAGCADSGQALFFHYQQCWQLLQREFPCSEGPVGDQGSPFARKLPLNHHATALQTALLRKVHSRPHWGR